MTTTTTKLTVRGRAMLRYSVDHMVDVATGLNLHRTRQPRSRGGGYHWTATDGEVAGTTLAVVADRLNRRKAAP